VSRRTATAPDRVKESIKYNAANATLANQGKGVVANYKEVTPFPITSDGLEAIWNHIFRWRGGIGVIQNEAGFAPQVDGSATKVSPDGQLLVQPGGGQGGQPVREHHLLVHLRGDGAVAAGRQPGAAAREHRPVARAAAGVALQRRPAAGGAARPMSASTTPSDAADGLLASDQVDMYNGSPERYDWKLLGKKELYIPYNNYEMNQPAVKYKDLLTPGHLNQQVEPLRAAPGVGGGGRS
jgi:hypothetical protein